MEALTLHRAAAPFASAERLAAALGWWRADPAHEGEWLLLPRLRMAAPSARHAQPAAMARALERALDHARAGATIDPRPGTCPAGALRFTRRESWLAWLAWRMIDPAPIVWPGHAAPPRHTASPDYAPLPAEPARLRAQIREQVLGEAGMLLSVSRRLLEQGGFAPWVGGWSRDDVRAALSTIAHGWGLPALLKVNMDGAAIAPLLRAMAAPAAHAQAEPALVMAARNAVHHLAPSPSGYASAAHHFTGALLAAIATRPAQAPVLMPLVARHVLMAFDEPLARGDGSSFHPYAHAKGQPGSAPTQTVRRAARASLAIAEPVPEPATLPVPIIPPAAPMQMVPWLGHPFASDYAGLLFLFNALMALGLYPDFTRPMDPRLAPSPGWVLAQIGRRWFGRGFARDPLCRWLEQSGLAAPLPEVWQVRRAWFHTRAPRQQALRTDHARLRLDPRGFISMAGPLRPGDMDLPPLRKTLRLPRNRDARWIACLALYLDHRLKEAGVSRGDLALCGRVFVGEEALIARFALADLPLSLRLAGLDRDPGWMPAEGRAIRFEFL